MRRHADTVVPYFDAFMPRRRASLFVSLDCLEVSAISHVLVRTPRCVFRITFARQTNRKCSWLHWIQKMNSAIGAFSSTSSSVRRTLKQGSRVVNTMDPEGVRKKLQKGRMLDPRLPANVDAVRRLLRGASQTTWLPLKKLVLISCHIWKPRMVRYIGASSRSPQRIAPER